MHWRSFLAIAGITILSLPLFAGQTSDVLAREVGHFTWVNNADHFGGFSAIELGPDGRSFTTISDRGWFRQGKILRNSAGQIVGVDTGQMQRLSPPDGKSWHRQKIDSEGLAIATDGSIFVSFEGMHRVFRYDDLTQNATPLPKHNGFEDLIMNGSLEALAIAPDGTLYTLPERSGHLARPFPIFRFRNGRWSQPFALPRTDDFLPVGADFGPDGKLYLLERRFQIVRGFANRVRRFTVTEHGFETPELLFESRAGKYHNLEGLAVWRTSEGRMRLTMISDDNFNFFQSTEIVEFEVFK